MVEPNARDSLLDHAACFNENHVATVTEGIANPSEIQAMATVFKAASEPIRAAILSALLVVDEMCVCDLSVSIGAGRSAVSRQLRYLREHNIVKPRKAAQLVFYSLHDQCIRDLLAICLDHVRHDTVEAGATTGAVEEVAQDVG